MPAPRGRKAFTLLELLAVCTILVLLAALVVGMAHYARLRANRNRAQAEIAVIEVACEAFKSELGRYPTSSLWRATCFPYWDYYGVYWETLNSSLLGNQLINGGYVPVGALTIRSNGVYSPFGYCNTATNTGWVTATNLEYVVMDPWERPYNYFCTYPTLPAAVQTSFWVGTCSYPYQPNPASNAVIVTATNQTGYLWYGGQVNLSSFDLWSYGPDKRSGHGTTGIDDIGNFTTKNLW